MKLANIYAWDIDFYSIDKGDWFKVIYDQQYVGATPVGIGRIKSAVFNHGGQKFYAFYFHDDSTNTDGYYDEKAKSLRKAFLKAPLKFYHITSHYSKHRFHPIQHRWKAHLGTDYAAPTGTPIMSTAAGTVIASRYSRFNGNYVKIRHNATYTTQYLHMSKRAVHVGEHVKQGQIIGYVGSTGLATGPHVCYRFWKNGKQVDPFKQHFPPAEPIAESDMAAFKALVHQDKERLDQIQMTGLASL
jgi:murein DD-endopeptidase MepM/ murein hydrolase activator NlpD